MKNKNRVAGPDYIKSMTEKLYREFNKFLSNDKQLMIWDKVLIGFYHWHISSALRIHSIYEDQNLRYYKEERKALVLLTNVFRTGKRNKMLSFTRTQALYYTDVLKRFLEYFKADFA